MTPENAAPTFTGDLGPLLVSGPDVRPGWLALDFTAVKPKLIAAIARRRAIPLSLGLPSVLLAAMARLNHRSKE